MATGITTNPPTTPEYVAINSLYSIFVTSFSQSPGDIVDLLMKYEVFSPQDQQYLRRDTVEERDKARKIMDIVEAKVKSNPSFYDEFRAVLRSGPWLKEIAKKLDDKYKQTKILEMLPTIEETTPQKGIYTHVSLYADTQSHQLNESRLQIKTNAIRRKFASLVRCVAKSMKKNTNIEVEEFVFYLSRLQAICTKYTRMNKECLLFDRSLIEEIKHKSDFYAVFDIIEKCYSWINYGLIESIIEEFCEEDQSVKTKLEKYKQELEQYCNDSLRIRKNFQQSVQAPDRAELSFKIDCSWEDLTSNNINEYRALISEILKLERDVLFLKTVEQGCVKCTFEIPQHVADILFPLTEEQTQALQQHHITLCGDTISREVLNGARRIESSLPNYPRETAAKLKYNIADYEKAATICASILNYSTITSSKTFFINARSIII